MNIDQKSSTADLGNGFPGSELYFLSTLSTAEGNTLGTVVNVGYQMAQVPSTNFAVVVNKWVLQRGDDAGVDPLTYPTAWWDNRTNPGSYWKTLSDNIVGISFQFYTDPDNFVTTWPPPAWPATTNALPTSVGISIWAIDTANYNLALTPGLDATVAQRILTNNVHKYTSRVFLPQSTCNSP